MMKRTVIFSAILFSVILAIITGCSSSIPSAAVTPTPTQTPTATAASAPVVQAGEAYNLVLQNKGNTDFVILDVRTPDEYNTSHISGAINIDIYASDFAAKVGQLDKKRTYLVYCRTGVRSTQATQIMAGQGFTRLYNLTGGITAWTAAGHPVEQPAK